MNTRLQFFFALVTFCVVMIACNRAGRAPEKWHVGGLYSTEDGKGQFSVVKILVLEPDAVHIRIYQQIFSSRPKSVDPTALTLGRLDDKNHFSIGHLPLSRKTFASWNPVFISQQSVSEGELEGFKMWKEAKGKTF
jgi:hypothetical protein